MEDESVKNEATPSRARIALPWDEWKSRLLAAASKDGMGGINPEDYRNWYEAGEDSEDTWAEDVSCG